MSPTRETGTTTVTTPSDLEAVITRVVEAPRELVWEAWTSPEHVPNWLLGPEGWTMPVCEIDLRPGGEWHFVWRKADGEEMGMRGTYREVAPPERLVSTESWGGDWPETLNTVVLTEEEGTTTIVLTVTYPSLEARDAALATGMTEGASLSFDRLAAHLRTMALTATARTRPWSRAARPPASGAVPRDRWRGARRSSRPRCGRRP